VAADKLLELEITRDCVSIPNPLPYQLLLSLQVEVELELTL
jgi:hypothetical protein